MKYNEKYDRWCDEEGRIYRQSKSGNFIECKQSKHSDNYVSIHVSKPKDMNLYSHRLIWETFNGKIPYGYEIDHINAVRYDNRLLNLRCVTPKNNMNNQLTKNSIRDSLKNVSKSSFGEKYIIHYGYSRNQNVNQYSKEYGWFKRHGKCRWE